jgi:hypothetical protein
VIKASFGHSWGHSLGNSSATIPELTPSWCLILRTIRTNAIVEQGGFPLRAAMNLLCIALWTPAERYTVNGPPFASIWIYSHVTACCFLFLVLPVLRTIFKCASWVISLVAKLAASWCTNLFLRTCYGPIISVFDVAPANLLVFDPRSPGGGGCVSIMCRCGICKEDDNERQWEGLRTK